MPSIDKWEPFHIPSLELCTLLSAVDALACVAGVKSRRGGKQLRGIDSRPICRSRVDRYSADTSTDISANSADRYSIEGCTNYTRSGKSASFKRTVFVIWMNHLAMEFYFLFPFHKIHRVALFWSPLYIEMELRFSYPCLHSNKRNFYPFIYLKPKKETPFGWSLPV